MVKVGLSGNRYSGKTTICKGFSLIGVPVFEADVILKLIINHDFNVITKIKETMGSSIFTPMSFVDPETIRSKEDFDKIIDCAYPYLMRAYDKFNFTNSHSIYTIFKSSILFERNWNSMMDFNICIFAPKYTRVDRCRHKSKTENLGRFKKDYLSIDKLLANEIEDGSKNVLANFVIHNYAAARPITEQISKIDSDIISKYVKANQLKRTEDDNLGLMADQDWRRILT